MTNVVQAEPGSIIDRTTTLDSEALKPAGQSILDRLNAQATSRGFDNGVTVEPAKRRGRPPGSKNKTTVAREALGLPPPGRTPGGTRPSSSGKELTPEEVREAREHRAVELRNKILEEFNENIMLVRTGAGVPAELLYKPGMAPKETASQSKYSGLGSLITVGPMQAGIYAKFLASAETTEMGKKLTGASGDGNTSLIVYGLLSVAATFQWTRGLAQFTKELKPMLEVFRAAEMARNAQTMAAQTQGA